MDKFAKWYMFHNKIPDLDLNMAFQTKLVFSIK